MKKYVQHLLLYVAVVSILIPASSSISSTAEAQVRIGAGVVFGGGSGYRRYHRYRPFHPHRYHRHRQFRRRARFGVAIGAGILTGLYIGSIHSHQPRRYYSRHYRERLFKMYVDGRSVNFRTSPRAISKRNLCGKLPMDKRLYVAEIRDYPDRSWARVLFDSSLERFVQNPNCFERDGDFIWVAAEYLR